MAVGDGVVWFTVLEREGEEARGVAVGDGVVRFTVLLLTEVVAAPMEEVVIVVVAAELAVVTLSS